jgi:hypothetical protein
MTGFPAGESGEESVAVYLEEDFRGEGEEEWGGTGCVSCV